MSKNFLIILAVLVLGFVGFIAFSGSNNNNNSGNGAGEVQPTEHKRGAGNKKVTLVEYADFQCIACFRFYPILQQVKEKYGDDITFQFRHFPITQVHPNAMSAHRAAEAASKQGKFWEMHDLLYERYNAWAEAQNAQRIMEDYATELGLNVEQFKQDYQSKDVNDRINADLAAGREKGVNSTPSFFLNGERIENAEPTPEFFANKIDEAIKKAEGQNN